MVGPVELKEIRDYLLEKNVSLIMKMNKFRQVGYRMNSDDFRDLWAILRTFIWKDLRNGGFGDQEKAVRDRLQKMAKYKRRQKSP